MSTQMSEQGATQDIQISVGADLSTVVIGVPDAIVINKPAPANDTAKPDVPKIGDVMPAGHRNAGWVYAGISQTTNKPFYVAAKDSGVFQWNAAMEFAAEQNARVPSTEELHQLFEAKNEGTLKGTFNVSGWNIVGWYCSSTDHRSNPVYAWIQRFDDGYRGWQLKGAQAALRLVRY